MRRSVLFSLLSVGRLHVRHVFLYRAAHLGNIYITFTFMHSADAFIQSDLHFRLYVFLSLCVFPGN